MSDLFTTLTTGSDENLKVGKVSIKEWFASNYDSTTTDVDTMLSQIGYAESKNKNVSQSGGGPGRGLYQFEKTFKNKDGEYEQAGGMTARNRLAHWYTKQKRPIPKWLNQEGMSDPSIGFDASKLTDEQQGELLMADFWQKKGSDPLIFSALDEVEQGGDAGELWLKKHWAGAEEGTQKYKDKKAQWQREMDSLGGSKKKGMGNFSDVFMEQIPFIGKATRLANQGNLPMNEGEDVRTGTDKYPEYTEQLDKNKRVDKLKKNLSGVNTPEGHRNAQRELDSLLSIPTDNANVSMNKSVSEKPITAPTKGTADEEGSGTSNTSVFNMLKQLGKMDWF